MIRVRTGAGWREIQSKLSPDLWTDSVSRLIRDVVRVGEQTAERNAPRLSGALSSGPDSEIVSGELRGFVLLRTPERRGFRYGFALDTSKSRTYRYRGRRKKTYRWFRSALSAMNKALRAAMKSTVDEIGSRWAN